MRRTIAFFAAFLAILGAAHAQAQARLVMNATGFVFTGEVVSYDGVNYLFKTNLGTILVPAVYAQCLGDGCPGEAESSGEFGMYGSNTIGLRLAPKLIEAFAKASGGSVATEATSDPMRNRVTILDAGGQRRAVIDMLISGSSAAFSGLASGDAQIGMSSRPATPQEVRTLAEAGYPGLRDPNREHVLALDGVAVVVAPDNPVQSISLSDLARVFAGEIVSWSQLGGRNAPINLYARADGSGAWDLFNRRVLQRFGKKLSPAAQRFVSNMDLTAAVTNDPNGIGFLSLAHAHRARPLTLAQSCGISQAPTKFAIKTGAYPLTQRLYLYTSGRQLDPTAAELLGYVLSDRAQDVVAEAGYVSQKVEEAPAGAEDSRLFGAVAGARDAMETMLARSAAAELAGAVRLSTTFRFDAAGELDAKAASDASRVARFIAERLKPGQEVVLVGYTDDRLSVQESFAAALSAADRVKAAIARDLGFLGVSPDVMTSLAYGALAPVACNDSPDGRAANRRVEVWIR